ncbi:type II toxin-antitoxin system RelE/ParE family toxin [Erwinia rhapontici]|uniref:type II toxin-antitoxin system RelE/ParE family toxin n=1 Tax=Erwinia TaxID=551 RepID=UPI001D0DABC6|nr:type II toxin-antitoxin system RelE/ParE family toxin [Erwinia rhapontici]UDQ80488.1 type II toxin-antitoxin system RelE/ParE family toxin [Erwinia rhapontici]
MPTYMTPEFDRDRKRFRISDQKLCKAADLVRNGAHDGHLGRSVYKKRIGVAGSGASNGARSIIFFSHGDHLYFFDIYVKSELSKKKGKELEMDEIESYCDVAQDFLKMNDYLRQQLIKVKELIEVNCDD